MRTFWGSVKDDSLREENAESVVAGSEDGARWKTYGFYFTRICKRHASAEILLEIARDPHHLGAEIGFVLIVGISDCSFIR